MLAMMAAASAEQILGSFMFVRHGDRLTKPTKYLTPLGVAEIQDAGAYFHDRYFESDAIKGLDSVYNSKQISVAVPDSDVLYKSSQGFVQTFYPPVGDEDAAKVPGASLANGTDIEMPFDGYQYVFIEGLDEESPDYWTIDGNDNCPAFTNASAAYFESAEFKALNASTHDFYQSLSKYTHGSLTSKDLSYANAYKVFDFFEVNYYHNETFYESLDGSMDAFNEVRYLQDQYSKSLNYNASNPVVAVGGATVLGSANSFLKAASNSSNPERLSIVFGSYDVFYSMFGLLGWMSVDESKFTGLVDYASALAFELVADDQNNQFVRAGLRNGTNVTQSSPEIEFFPVFGNTETLIPLSQFQDGVSKVAISDVSSWCSACSATTDTCAKISLTSKVDTLEKDQNKSSSGLSLVDAGGIGAGVTVGVFLIVGVLGFLVYTLLLKPKKQAYDPKNIELGSTSSTFV